MRITIDIGENELRQIQRITRQKKLSPAINQALSDYICHRKQKFIERALTGQTDYPLTNNQLEARDVYEAH